MNTYTNTFTSAHTANTLTHSINTFCQTARKKIGLYVEEEAHVLGMASALIINKIRYWTDPQKSKNYKEDRYWTYNSLTAWQQQLKVIAERTLRRVFKRLEDLGILITRKFNAWRRDQRKWHCVDEERLKEVLQAYASKQAKPKQKKSVPVKVKLEDHISPQMRQKDAQLMVSNVADCLRSKSENGRNLDVAKLATSTSGQFGHISKDTIDYLYTSSPTSHESKQKMANEFLDQQNEKEEFNLILKQEDNYQLQQIDNLQNTDLKNKQDSQEVKPNKQDALLHSQSFEEKKNHQTQALEIGFSIDHQHQKPDRHLHHTQELNSGDSKLLQEQSITTHHSMDEQKQQVLEVTSPLPQNIAKEMILLWNQKIEDQPDKITLTFWRRRSLLKAFHQFFNSDLKAWQHHCDIITHNSFLMGGGSNGWKAGLDWALRPDNIQKVREKTYTGQREIKVAVPVTLVPREQSIQGSDLWQQIARTLIARLSEATFQAWFTGVTLRHERTSCPEICFSSKFKSDWIKERYGLTIETSVKEVMPHIEALKFGY